MPDYDLLHDGEELDACIDEVVAARGSEASLSARLSEIVSDFEADQQRQETEIGVVAALGAKNFLKNTAVSQTISGVTFTINSDKSVTLSGTATSNITSFFISREVPALTGHMILSGCPEGGSTNTYRLDILDGTPNGSVLCEDHGDGAIVDWGLITTGIFTARIRIGAGTTVDGLTFKPMLRRSEITDSTYAPYAPTNRELYETEQRQALRYEDSAIIRLNQLSWSQTYSGSGMWIADCYTTQSIDTIVSVIITQFGALKPDDIKTLFTYVPSSVSGMHTVRLVCDRDLTGISSNPALYLRVFGYGYQASSLRSAPASLMQAGRIDAELADAGRIDAEQAAAEPAAAETGEEADA